ncbi:MAG TPA: GDSL-type esterase/lipase family protein [Opitutaceae bacterium]
MKRILRALLLALLVLPLLRGADDVAAKRWAQYEPSFKAFADADAKSPPAPGGILFVGSSIFRQWSNVSDQMAPLPVLNRAFGGSVTGDLVARFAQLVPHYRPKVVVYYCGSNDLKAASPDDPAVIFARFREFAEKARAFDSSIRIVFVASFRSPDRVKRWEQVDHYNALARAYCAADPLRTFVDLNPLIVDDAGHPRLELFKDDKLHYVPAAYDQFAATLKPVLERVWAQAAAKR